MLRPLLLAIPLLLAVLPSGVLPGCRQDSSKDATDSQAQEIRVGVLLPLTGNAGALGKDALLGIQLAIAEYIQDRSPNEPAISIIPEDTGADPNTGISAFRKLTSVNDVSLLIGPLASGVTLAVAPLAERNRIVVLSPGSSAPSISTAGDYIFRNELSEEYGARRQAELAYETLKFQRVAMLYVDNEYGVGTSAVFKRRFQDLGGEIVVEDAFESGESNYRTSISKARSQQANAIFYVYQDDAVNFVRQCTELGVDAVIYTTPVFENQNVLNTLGELANGVVYTYYGGFDPESANTIVQTFVDNYEREHGETPSYYASLGYDAARIMIHALRAADFEEAGVKEALYQIRQFPGVTGTTTFDSNGDVTKPVRLRIVRNEQFTDY